jgi:hypothetical protein
MSVPPRWQFILTDLAGNQIGEISQAAERSVTLPLNRIPTATFRIPLWHPLAGNVLGLNCLLKVYRRDIVTGVNQLVFHGLLLSAEESAADNQQTIAVTATGPMWRLTKRFIGTTKAGILFGPTLSDLGTIAQQILTAANGVWSTGINNGTNVASTNGVYGTVWLKNVGEAIAELSSGLNSFDYEVAPIEPVGTAHANSPYIGVLNTIPLIGSTKPDAIFEYGTARGNVVTYNRRRDFENLLNAGLISVSGWPDGTTQDVLVRNADSSITAYGRYEDVVNDAGVTDDGLRYALLDANLAARSGAREIVTFSVAQNSRPAPFTDYIVGDTIRGRAVVRGSLRFDAMFRIWGITFKIDQNGNEALDLQLVQDA